jgi:protein-S-isoprenylcysteine O-methyltransferase Ste14
MLLLALAASYLLNRWVPVHTVVPEIIRYLGAVPVLAAIWIVLKAGRLFQARKTTVMPYKQSTVLVTDGFYEKSRNPMYVAMLLFLTGVAWMLGSDVSHAALSRYRHGGGDARGGVWRGVPRVQAQSPALAIIEQCQC